MIPARTGLAFHIARTALNLSEQKDREPAAQGELEAPEQASNAASEAEAATATQESTHR